MQSFSIGDGSQSDMDPTPRSDSARRERILSLGESPRRMDPRMIFSADHSTLYVSVPKTGCTTIKTVVAACVGLLEPDLVSRSGRVPVHRTLKGREERWSDLTDAERDEMLCGDARFRFTSVRNPYERLVSCYLNKIADGEADYHLARRLRRYGEVSMLSFLKYVADQPPLLRDVHCRAMVDLCYYGKVTYDDIVRYESFEDDIKRILERLNAESVPIPRPGGANRTDAALHLDELLGPEECSLIREIYQRDFEAFGYSEHHQVNTTRVAAYQAEKRMARDRARAKHPDNASVLETSERGAGLKALLAAFRREGGAPNDAAANGLARLTPGWALVGLMAMGCAACLFMHPEPGIPMAILAAVAIIMTFSAFNDRMKVAIILLSSILFLAEMRAIVESRKLQDQLNQEEIQNILKGSMIKS
jgi:hypothetical protein